MSTCNVHEVQTVNQEAYSTEPLCYQKPKTTLFLEKATDVQGGVSKVLESQGSGYLTS